jgi:anti-anti-sigma factor
MNDGWDYTVSREADACTVMLSGELDMSAHDTLLEIVTAEVGRPGVRAVRADLSAVSFLDSSIMSVFVNAYLKAQDLGRSFTVAGQTGIVQRNLNTAGLLQLLAP